MKSLQELFCAAYRCDVEAFSQKFFWRCLHRRAILLAPLFGGYWGEHFEADRELIAGVGRAVDLNGVHSEIREFHLAANNCGWSRRRAKVRVSAQRVLDLARKLFGEMETTRTLNSRDSGQLT